MALSSEEVELKLAGGPEKHEPGASYKEYDKMDDVMGQVSGRTPCHTLVCLLCAHCVGRTSGRSTSSNCRSGTSNPLPKLL
jgi:hypothetical protein